MKELRNRKHIANTLQWQGVLCPVYNRPRISVLIEKKTLPQSLWKQACGLMQVGLPFPSQADRSQWADIINSHVSVTVTTSLGFLVQNDWMKKYLLHSSTIMTAILFNTHILHKRI